MLKLTSILSGIVVGAALSGCVVAGPGTSSGSYGSGTLTTGWTLDGSSYSDVCKYYRVDSVNVVVVADDGYVEADEAIYCEDFGVSFDLPTGWYSTEATLLDWDGYAVSDTIVVDVSVERDLEVFVDIDFPGGAIG
jgi:hypothetical protein